MRFIHRKNAFQPVIIIAAGRSGTNMIRDILTRLPGFGTWPCDEINYIWRHGNARYPTDEISANQATESVKRYIRRSFACIARKQRIKHVVEKTCANSLRVPFVERVVPEAKYIFILRDGRDVAASAMKRWLAPMDIPYLMKKARFVPITDVPYYGIRYLGNRIHRFFSCDNRTSFWGPRFEGMDEMICSRSLAEVCAIQWVRCVEKADHDLNQLDSSCIHRVKYEDFVTNPYIELQALLDFLNIRISNNDIYPLIQGVNSKSVGKWKRLIDPMTLASLEALIMPTMKRHGYV